MSISDNILSVRQRIGAAAERSSRDPSSVKLVAVTKTVDLEDMEQALATQVEEFGENRVQELLRKYPHFAAKINWHLIGHLQSNKVKQVLGKAQLIHSLDRLSLAREISRTAQELQLTVPLLVQVNISGEESKYGLSTVEVNDFLAEIHAYPGINIKGLMTMAPLVPHQEEARPVFKGLATLAEDIKRQNFPGVTMNILSMGMTNDFEVAVEEGANLVRVGSAIFGPSMRKV
jgi:PLP dependent protein